jgi:hypothetical protein
MRPRVALIITIVALLLLIPATASAALVDEQRQGQGLIAQLAAGTKTCRELSANDLDHIGEYVMFRALGSTALHQAMNDRMTLMMGEQAETRMHQLLGARYAGCSTRGLGIPGYGTMMGGAGMMGGADMMGGDYSNGGWGAMMSSGEWNWMMGGSWQHMTRQDWKLVQERLLGTNTTDGHTGWSALAVAGVAVGATVLGLLAILAIIRRWPRRRPPTPAPSS